MLIKDLLDVLGGAQSGRDSGKAIVEHMNWLLNTSQGTVSHMPKFGLPEFEEFLGDPNVEKILASEVRKLLETFEPRLTQIRVFPEEGAEGSFYGKLNVTLRIEAVLVDSDEHLAFEEHAKISHMGEVDLF